MPYFGSYITPEGARRIPHYKYKGSDDSLILKYITDPLYTKWVTYFPTWMAPNLITLTGLSFTIASHIVLICYCPRMENKEDEVVPPWVHLFAAFSVLAYQAFDAMDGKQARRTKSGSPLGMLFDHGCDAVNTTIICMNLCCALQTGPTLWAIQLWVTGGVGFFAQTLEEYYTGEMHLPMINAPNEGIMWSAAIHIVAACVPVKFWKEPNFYLVGLCPMNAFVFVASLMGLITVLYNIYMIADAIYKKEEMERSQNAASSPAKPLAPKKSAKSRNRSRSKNGSATKSNLGINVPSPRIASQHKVPVYSLAVAITRFVPLILFNIMMFYWMKFSSCEILEKHPRMFLWILGITQAKVATGTMLAHICEEEFHPNGRTTACATVLAGHICFCLIFNKKEIPYTKLLTGNALQVEATQPMEELCLYQLSVLLSLSYFHMVTKIVAEVSSILGIHPFLITPRKGI